VPNSLKVARGNLTIMLKPYPDPPPHLSERSKLLWREIGPLKVNLPGQLPLFTSALECLDRVDEVRCVIAAEGLTSTTRTTGAQHIHPLLKIEAAARQQFARLWVALRLADEDSLFGISVVG
jgi:phage terminase small subunit